jgi:RNA polymerase sigma factor (sigma-70 family)
MKPLLAIDVEALADRMTAGEQSAYGEFARYFGRRFRTLFLNRLPAKDAEELAVSCVSDVAVVIHKYKKQKGGSFQAWALRIARNKLADWWRSHVPEVSLAEDLISKEDSTINVDDSNSNPDPSDPDPKVVLAVQEAVAQLSPKYRQIICLRHLDGVERTYQEIADYLSTSVNAVKTRHCRALRVLESILERNQVILERLKRPRAKGKAASL